jgi:hypothetical protein
MNAIDFQAAAHKAARANSAAAAAAARGEDVHCLVG